MADGRVIMHRGYACGRGACIITTTVGTEVVRQHGLQAVVVDLTAGSFYRG
jgi:hypothetical protein